MAYGKKSRVEHVAVRVKDIDWHLCFFREVLGMTVRETAGSGTLKKAWTTGGMQFNADPDFNGPEGRLAHVLAEARKWSVRELPTGRNWLALPDGLELELMEAPAVKPRA
jgi:catechol 2,3-dioxygenase-like lactoylglutathione lyase family enzyme